MSTYYDFMVEAKYEGKWYNIDFHTKDIDGKLRHQYLATISRSFIGLLEDQVNGAWAIEQPFKIIEIPGYIEALQSKTMSPATRLQLMKNTRLTKFTNT